MKADFFAALWNVVNWPDVAARLDAAKKLNDRRLNAGGRPGAGRGTSRRQVLLAQAPGGVTLQVGIEDRRTAGLALPVGALAQALEGPVDAVEDGRGPGQLGFVALFHERAG